MCYLLRPLCILLKGQIFKIAIKDILVSSICVSLNRVMKKNGWHPAPHTGSGLPCSRLIFSSACSVFSYPLVYLHNYRASTGCAGAVSTPALSQLRQRAHTEGQSRLTVSKWITINKIQESVAWCLPIISTLNPKTEAGGLSEIRDKPRLPSQFQASLCLRENK